MKKEKYTYSQKIERERKTFRTWLEERKYRPNTARMHSNYAAYFLSWLEAEKNPVTEVGYKDLLAFIAYCRQEGDTSRMIAQRLNSVRHYYDYLKRKGKENPASGLYVKSEKRRLVRELLTKEELEYIYENYPDNDERGKRNRIILGLLVFQALTTEELHKLRERHLHLRAGKISVPQGQNRNGRILKLEAHQVLDLQEYVLVIRPKIIREASESKRYGRKPKRIATNSDQLFVSMNGSENIKSSLKHLMSALRKIHRGVKHGQQIRMSVITHWLKEKDLREVQYMTGFRDIESLEYYRRYNTEDLEAELKKYHPLQ